MNGQTFVRAFVPLPGQAQAVYDTTNGLYFYRHADWLGSARIDSTPLRTANSSTAYAPFGEPYAQAPAQSDVAFTGPTNFQGLYDFTYREYNTQGRWPTPDPAGLAAVDPSNPQSWNRYTYVLNNPCNRVDPIGLDSCAINVVINNQVGLPTGDLAQIKSQIQAIFSQTGDGQGNSVSINFTATGADATVNLTTAPWYRPFTGNIGHTGCRPIFGCSSTASVYVDHINSLFISPPGPGYIGAAAAHELWHSFTGTWFDSCSDPNNLSCGKNVNGQPPNATNNGVNSQQIATIFKKCLKLHPSNAGGGGAASSVSGGGWGFWSPGPGEGGWGVGGWVWNPTPGRGTKSPY